MSSKQLIAGIISCALMAVSVFPVGAETITGSSVTVLGISSATAVSPVEVSTGTMQTSDRYSGLTSAIGDLNYKIELMQTRYHELGEDIENLRSNQSALRKMIEEDRLSLPDTKMIDRLNAGAEQLRSEIDGLHHDVTEQRSQLETLNSPEYKKTDFFHSPWLAVIAVGISIAAIATR